MKIEVARQHFNRHLMAIGAGPMGLPHTGYKMNGTMEIMGQPGKNVFSMEQKIPNLYYIRISLAGTGVFERAYDGEQFWERTPEALGFSVKKRSYPYKRRLISNDGKIMRSGFQPSPA